MFTHSSELPLDHDGIALSLYRGTTRLAPAADQQSCFQLIGFSVVAVRKTNWIKGSVKFYIIHSERFQRREKKVRKGKSPVESSASAFFPNCCKATN